jgi:hypothetical protein
MERNVARVQDLTARLGQHALTTVDCYNEQIVLLKYLKIFPFSQAWNDTVRQLAEIRVVLAYLA